MVGVVEDAIGDALSHDDAGDARHHVVQALDVLHVDRGVHIDARTQELLDILVALGVAAARRVGVGELVHKREPGRPGERSVEVELRELHGAVAHETRLDHLEPR